MQSDYQINFNVIKEYHFLPGGLKMKKYIAGILCIIVIFTVKETRASGCANGFMDIEIIDIISPPQVKGSDYHCRLKVKIQKVYNLEDGSFFESLQSKTVESTFELKDDSLEKMILKGNTVFVSVSQCGYTAIELDPSTWHSRLLMETVDFSKHKPVPFQKSSLYGYKNHKGDIVIDPVYREALPFLDTGIAAVKGDYGWEYINYFGMYIINPYVENDRPDAFNEGLARYKYQYGNVHENTCFVGFMNQTGEAVIKAEYIDACPFSEGLAAVLVKSHGEPGEPDTWGYIDKKGTMIIEPYFLKVSSFKNGRAVVFTKNMQQIVINRGREIIE
jgi:hypothetical protein